MKTASLILLLSLLFFACTQLTPLQTLIHDADVVKVFVYSDNVLVMHYESNDVPTIQYWKNFIADDSAMTSNDCIPAGKIIFQTAEDSTMMKFSLKEGCRYVSYQLNGVS